MAAFFVFRTEGNNIMNLNRAVALRISGLLEKKKMKKYALEKKSGILHGTLECIMRERNKTVTLTTIFMLARGFDMTVLEFLDDKLFQSEDLEIE